MAFFTYNQNNSGGGFDFDERAGITHYVIVEAADAREANYRAERIGLYFDGADDDGPDCPCCGDRWYAAWDDDEGTEVPEIYGEPAQDYGTGEFDSMWMGDRPEVFIHFSDGHFQGYGFETRVLEA